MNGPLPALSDLQIAGYARQAGFAGEGLLTIIATVLAESGGDPDNIGDEALQNATWGPSVGLAQIRSLRAESGTGRPRDATRLTDPAFNLRSAFSISSGGRNFRPWTAFTSGAYRSYLERAWRAVASPGTARVGTGLEGASGVQTLAGVELPGAGVVEDLVEPLTSGLARIALVSVFVAGGVVLIVAGGWRSTTNLRAVA